MKATFFQLTSKKNIELIDRELPELDCCEVRGETHYSAISPGTELAAWQGKAPLRPSKVYPRLLGYCNLAKVIGVGRDVKDIEIGEYILTHESHRSHFNIDTKYILCHFKNLQPTALISIATTYLFHLGYSALLKADYFPGHRVAIVGFGALGFCTSQLVHAFAGSPDVYSSMDKSRVETFKYAKIRSKVKQTAQYGKYDIVINTSDSWDDYLLSLELLRVGGTCVLIGFPGRNLPKADFNPLDSRLLYDKQLQLKYAGYAPECDVAESDIRFTLKKNVQYLANLILHNRLNTTPLTSLVRNWDEITELYSALNQPEKKSLSGVLKWI